MRSLAAPRLPYDVCSGSRRLPHPRSHPADLLAAALQLRPWRLPFPSDTCSPRLGAIEPRAPVLYAAALLAAPRTGAGTGKAIPPAAGAAAGVAGGQHGGVLLGEGEGSPAPES